MDIETQLPLTEPAFFILLALSSGPQYGYAIMKDTVLLSHGRVQMSTSTLYGAIKRLRDLDWITYSVVESGIENGRERKVYQLTDLGRNILKAEGARLQSLAALAQKAGESVSP